MQDDTDLRHRSEAATMQERELFLAALEIENPADRQAHLQAACAGDAELQARVERLLASHDCQSQFLNIPVVEQISGDSSVGTDATHLLADGTTQGENSADADDAFDGDATLTERLDDSRDETPLGYLEPSSRPGSIGRMAHYEILEVIGRGAFGTVLRAFDEKLQRVVAIKVMAPELANTSPARKRFLREARASAAIRHENVVSVYAVEEKPLPYLVMEYIPGRNLLERLDEQGPLDVLTVLRIGTQIAEGLAAAHAQDLIHRDIKPANILLEAGVRERVKVTDFGLARAADDASVTQSGTIAGTPMYMAPEQALGRKLDQRADLFSFGSVLYQMVSGRPPFRAPNSLSVLKRLTEEQPRPIREIVPETPQWLCDIITKLHAKNPDERYQSARQVADVLASCESQLKAYSDLKDFSLVPRAKTQFAGRWKLVAAVALVLPLLAFAPYALVNRPVAQSDVGQNGTIKPQTTDPIEPGRSPTSVTAGESQPPPAESVWLTLFNGKDLTGWKTTAELPGKWEVKNGILMGSSRQSYLFSERADFANFHLRIEVMTNGMGDSGIYFRAPFSLRHGPKAGLTQPASGYEVDLFNRPLPVGTITEIVKGVPPRPLCRAVSNTVHRAGEWFILELIANENHLITKVNGQETVDCRDSASQYAAGHLALSVFDPLTVVLFRKIEVKVLPPSAPSSAPAPQAHRYSTNEWIDVIPLIDPQLDKWDMRLTGKNEWQIIQGELVVGSADDKPHKLLLPLDADFFPSFECELDVTRRAGDQGFNLNFPTASGDTPLSFEFPGSRGVFLRHARKGKMPISEAPWIETGKRTTIFVEVRRQEIGDRITVRSSDGSFGTWTGDRNELASGSNEGYEHRRRLGLWIHGGGSEFVFHRIRVRMLDGGNAESLRPVPSAAPTPDRKSEDAAANTTE